MNIEQECKRDEFGKMRPIILHEFL